MKLARKLTILLVVSVLLVMALNAVFRGQFESAQLETELRGVQQAMGLTLLASIEAVLRYDGQEKAMQVVREAERIEPRVNIRWVWLDEQPVPGESPEGMEERLRELRRGKILSFQEPGSDGETVRYTYVPLVRAGLRPGALELSQSLEPQKRFLQGSRRIVLLAAAGVALVSSVVISLATYLLVGRPIRRLRDAARRIGAGDFTARLRVHQQDEIGDLGREINSMCEQLEEASLRVRRETNARLAAVEQLRHADRLTTVGQIASGVAHEIGTPLNVISETAEMIRTGEASPEQASRIIVQQSDRIGALVRQLLDYSRQSPVDPVPTDMARLAADTTSLLRPIAARRNIALDWQASSPSLPLEGDPGKLQQAMTNLIMNAVQASPPGENVTVSSGTSVPSRKGSASASAGTPMISEPCAFFQVADHGPGVPPENLTRIFQPFFTTKRFGEGTGLGLTIAEGIAREHGGWIEVEPNQEKGAIFTLWIPMAPAATRTQNQSLALRSEA